MKLARVYYLLMGLLITGCAAKALPPVHINIPTRTIDYQKEVKPLLDKRCTVCHSCYNSPCQLKMDSFEGTDRGASKQAVYNASRLTAMDPTRLFTDAQSTEDWRKKDFFSVTESTVANGLYRKGISLVRADKLLNSALNDSIMIQLLSHKMKNPKSTGEYSPETDDLTCSENRSEVAGYLKKHPNRGMPYGFPPLKPEEFEIIAGWLVQGAKGPNAEQQAELATPKAPDAQAIHQWETFLNQNDAKHAMTARYLYEHLFLAHLKFGTPTNEYYEMVRSRTAPGQPLELIPTLRPYDDPGVAQVYYRFRKIYSTIVHKTHMVFTLDAAQLQRFEELFIEPEWLQTPHQVGYDQKLSANPFMAFEQIPPGSRYQFLLDNSLYTIKTFIQGPVCKGQIALNVIDDHFWVMFLDPEHDLSVKYPGFLRLNGDRLRMPIEQGSNQQIVSTLTDEYRKAAVEYYRARQDFYAAHNYAGLGYEAIWKGNRGSDAPALTVYRHFDSASVHKGLLGNMPKTLWVIDYPLLERIYYALVAGFDVYGTTGHQLALRIYMDALRVEGESSFLDFLPPEKRPELMQAWNIGTDLERINYYPSSLPAQIPFTGEPKREFMEHLVNQHLLPATGIRFDPVNYRAAGVGYPRVPGKYATSEDYLRTINTFLQPGTPFFTLINSSNANLAYVRIRLKNGEDLAGSIVINRWHDNVAYILGEDERLDPTKDSADILPGLIGSYPNYFIDVREEDLPDFFDLMASFNQKSPRDMARLAKYAINRADDRLWDAYDWFQQRFYEDEPVEGGLFDLNRYYYNAR